MARMTLTESDLIGRIAVALEGQGACRDCVPTALSPIHPIAGSANWQVLEHPPCSDPCQAAMLEACARLADSYDVDWPPQRGAAR